jgi:hypothetical protein
LDRTLPSREVWTSRSWSGLVSPDLPFVLWHLAECAAVLKPGLTLIQSHNGDDELNGVAKANKSQRTPHDME